MEKNLSRRQFLKLSGATAATLAIVQLGFNEDEVHAKAKDFKIQNMQPTPTICPYCAVGCGILVYATEKDVVYTEGDPDHPISEGNLCSKGSAVRQIYTSEKRVTKPLYRAPGSNQWQEKDWNWMLDKIVQNIKDTRDRTFQKASNGITVNRTEAIASLGGAALDNEETYLLQKLMRGLGLVYIEHQARLCHSSTVGGLAPTFGRGAMTNHWNDMQYTDVALIIGSNIAENHPVGFKFLMKAQEKGAKLISVDPRFTRTSAKSDVYGYLRSGTDIAFIGGLINYILENELYQKEYVVNYTNAASLVAPSYTFNDGIFSGYDETTRKYDQTVWGFQKDPTDKVLRDVTLQNPQTVFQLMKNHYKRYDIDTVCNVTGMPKEKFLEIAKIFCGTGDSKKVGTILYAMGTTQHTVGSQNIRAYAIMQLLLGNIGFPGGGINALRGESNVQGSTDFGLLFNNVPGYMEVPQAIPTQATYKDFLTLVTPPKGYWSNKPKFYTSFLKAMYGEKATKENEFGFQFLPKLDPHDYSHMTLFQKMFEGSIEGTFLFGANPSVGGPNTDIERKALEKLKWMVAIDLWETETSAFWQKEAGVDPSSIQTEVFLLPACSSFEKEGSISNSGRWMQYRWQGIKPKGDSRADLDIIHQLALRIKEAYKGSSKPEDAPIQALTWNFGTGESADIEAIAKEINGSYVATGQQVAKFGDLLDDGSTSSGCWIYCGFYPEEQKNLSKRRDNKDTGMNNFLNWSYAWPMNRRVLYNRASCDLTGQPYDKDRAIIWWDSTKNEWGGLDVPDFKKDVAPTAEGGTQPFIMQKDGRGGLFAARNDGPFPEHYEPFESPVENPFNSQSFNPASIFYKGDFNVRGDKSKYPIVATTYRMSEHWQTGAMTRNLPWLAELAPYMFVEISEELAKEKGIKNKDKIVVSSARGEIEAYAVVTKRFKPQKVMNKNLHQIGMIWHFGYKGIVKGDTANKLTPHIGDANTNIPEYKAFLCDVRRA